MVETKFVERILSGIKADLVIIVEYRRQLRSK